MTIVTTRPRKRPAKPAQAATIKVTSDRAAYAEGQGVEVAAAGRSRGQGAGCRFPGADGYQAAGRGLRELARSGQWPHACALGEPSGVGRNIGIQTPIGMSAALDGLYDVVRHGNGETNLRGYDGADAWQTQNFCPTEICAIEPNEEIAAE
jgi:hypothetical protein